MQPLQETDRSSAERPDADSTLAESAPGRALGLALGLRAEECCDLCYARAAAYTWAGRPPDPTYTERSRGVNWLATALIARWIAYRVPVAAEEMRYIAERGDLAASLQQSTLNITRAYLIWRDTISEVLRDEAVRLHTPRDVLSDGLRAVRTSCDASLIQVARSFDSRMAELSQELAAERQTLLHQALHDPLTGLPNRVLLYDRINQAVLASKRSTGTFAILAIDLDGFKAVNDSLGHDGGDIVLQQVADRLVNSVREADTVARQGGDEFSVLLAGTDAEGASDIARKLKARISRVLTFGGESVSVGATIGVAAYPADGDDVHSLLRAADHAMYRCKRERRSQAE
ncbi:MAG TPA: GGDEF domain-containing protein [Candidatus Acidoferrales bacterium]|nr:GGDEF domain-containing protein [Candidatus Acidoferrales bacterium]